MKVYASVIFAALILQSAQDTAADCTTNCQNRFRRNATSDFNSDCHMGVLQSYVDCLANGSCLTNSNVKIGIQQNYEECRISYHGDYSFSGSKQSWNIRCCYANPPDSCTDTCSLMSACTMTKPLPVAAMLGGAIAMLMLIL